jgi:SH3 domain protein
MGSRSLRLALFFLLLIPIALSVKAALAETRYVSDELVITMRSGKGNEYRIIKSLTSGTPVEVIGDEGDYLMVRTAGGEEGWVLKQYITSETPKAKVIAALRQEIDRLKATAEELRNKKDSLQAELNAASQSHSSEVKKIEKEAGASREEASRTARELERVKGKYEAFLEQSKDVVALVEERDRLRDENDKLQGVEERLAQENERLRRTGMIKWFIAGAGVFLVGWIVGKASRKKRLY